MTLRSRNTVCFIFMIVAALFISIGAILFIHALHNELVSPPASYLRPYNMGALSGLLSYSFSASIAGLAILASYSLGLFIVISSLFEKTQCTEVVFFLGFAIACLIEGIKIFTVVLPIDITNYAFLKALTRIVVFARTLAILAFFFSAVTTGSINRTSTQYTQRNFIIILAISLLVAFNIPIDSFSFKSYLILECDYRHIYKGVAFLVIMATLCAMLIAAYKTLNKSSVLIALGYMLSILGYNSLIVCDNWLFFAIGAASLFIGTYLYLISLHNTYMWN